MVIDFSGHETRSIRRVIESSRTRSNTCRVSPKLTITSDDHLWRSSQGKQPIYLTHHWDRRWTVKVKVHSSKSIVLPLAGVKITVTIKSQTYLLHNLRLHALLPQVRKECRVIKGLLLDNVSIDISCVCKNIDRLWVTFQYTVHWVNVRLNIHYSYSLHFCQVNLTLIVKLDHQDQGSNISLLPIINAIIYV